jgi:hypothetical protein
MLTGIIVLATMVAALAVLAGVCVDFHHPREYHQA